MTTKEIKTYLHGRIDDIKDNDFLLSIKEIVEDSEISSTKEPVLEEWQINRIENANASIEKGEFLTDEEARKIIDELLKR